MIDHGAALYFHHSGGDYVARSRDPFPEIRDHVLLPFAGALADVDASMAGRLDERTLRAILALVPDAWLANDRSFSSADARRAAYVDYLRARLAAPRAFVEEALSARSE
jgi:hypothetical protein